MARGIGVIDHRAGGGDAVRFTDRREHGPVVSVAHTLLIEGSCDKLRVPAWLGEGIAGTPTANFKRAGTTGVAAHTGDAGRDEGFRQSLGTRDVGVVNVSQPQLNWPCASAGVSLTFGRMHEVAKL